MQGELTFHTRGPGLYGITSDVSALANGQDSGLLTLLILHSSASLLIQENADPDVQTDLRAYLERLVPDSNDPSMSYLRHTYEGPDDMPAHIKAALLPVNLQIPVRSGRLVLGTWQGVYLVEHRTAPHQRRIAWHFAPDAAR